MHQLPATAERCAVHEGHFGILYYYGQLLTESGVEWYSCRDSFHDQHRRRQENGLGCEFYYVCSREWMAKFLRHVEDALGINRRTQLIQTSLPNVSLVRPASFWMRQPMRFSLFSLVLRAGLKYDGTASWRRCLSEQPYLAFTREAVELFLAGNTRYRGVGDNWWRQFDGEVLRSHGVAVASLLSPPSWPERTIRAVGRLFRLT